MKGISLRVIPHQQQRYETVGDWWFDSDGMLQIRVSCMEDWRYEALISVHEIVEALLCRNASISQEVVDAFDKSFEDERNEYNKFDEPGDDPRAPYHLEHCIATGVERLLCAFLGLSWKIYDQVVNAV